MDRFRAALALALLLAACTAEPPASSEPAADTSTQSSAATASPVASGSSGEKMAWELLDPAPFERIEMATVAHGGEIWLVGGLNANGSASNETWRFDPGTGEWREGPRVDRPIHHAAAVSTGDGLYVIGGYEGSGFDVPRTTVLVLSAAGDGWGAGPGLPQPRAAGGAAWDGGRIVYGGGVGLGVVSDVLALTDGEWVRLGAMRSPREHLSATSDGDGRVWLMGGRVLTLDTNTGVVDLVEGNVVTRIGELATPRGGAAAFHLSGVGACLAGGEQPDRALDAVECGGADGSLTTLPALAVAVHGHGAAVVGGEAYIVLGGPEPLLTVSNTIQHLSGAAPGQTSGSPDIRYVDGLDVDQLVGGTEARGLSCVHSDFEASFAWAEKVLQCEGDSPDGRAQYTVTASYDGESDITGVRAFVLPLQEGATWESAGPHLELLAGLTYAGSDSDAALAELNEAVADPGCGGRDCAATIGSATFWLQTGVPGGLAVSLEPNRIP